MLERREIPEGWIQDSGTRIQTPAVEDALFETDRHSSTIVMLSSLWEKFGDEGLQAIAEHSGGSYGTYVRTENIKVLEYPVNGWGASIIMDIEKGKTRIVDGFTELPSERLAHAAAVLRHNAVEVVVPPNIYASFPATLSIMLSGKGVRTTFAPSDSGLFDDTTCRASKFAQEYSSRVQAPRVA